MKKLLVVLTLGALAAFLPLGCDKTKAAIEAGTSVFVDCEKEDISQIASDDGLTLLGEAVRIVQAGGDGWRAALEDLGARVGQGALACAVNAARSTLASHSYTVSPPEGATRASAFIAEHNWRFTR